MAPQPEVDHNPDGVDTTTTQTEDGIVDPVTGERTGDPRFDPSLDDADDKTDEDLEKARERQRKIRKASKDMDDEDEDQAGNLRQPGTNLSSDGGGGQQAAPMSNQTPQQSMPQSTPQVQSPQMQIPAGSTPISSDKLNKLMENYSPAKGDGVTERSESTPSGKNISNKDKLAVDDVLMEKTKGPLTKSQFDKVLEEAMDKVGIPEDKKIRSEWKNLYQYMALHESSRNPGAAARSGSDYNVQISGGKMGSDGEPVHTSRGILQCVPGTFAAYHVSGTSRNIYDAVASSAASMNYVMDKYHVSPNGGSSLDSFARARGFPGGPYKGY